MSQIARHRLSIAPRTADLGKVVGVAHLTDFTTLGTPQFGQAIGLALPFLLSFGATLYAAAVARAAITPAFNSDMVVAIRLLQD